MKAILMFSKLVNFLLVCLTIVVFYHNIIFYHFWMDPNFVSPADQIKELNQMNQAMEKKMARTDPMDDNLALYRQQVGVFQPLPSLHTLLYYFKR